MSNLFNINIKLKFPCIIEGVFEKSPMGLNTFKDCILDMVVDTGSSATSVKNRTAKLIKDVNLEELNSLTSWSKFKDLAHMVRNKLNHPREIFYDSSAVGFMDTATLYGVKLKSMSFTPLNVSEYSSLEGRDVCIENPDKVLEFWKSVELRWKAHLVVSFERFGY